MDKDILEILKEIQQDIKELKEGQSKLEVGQLKLEQGQNEIKSILQELEPQNANRHVEITAKINAVEEKVDLLRQDLNKVEVVTSQNSYEIQYLKAVK